MEINKEYNATYTETVSESIKHVNEYGQEYWYARELQKVLEYYEWQPSQGCNCIRTNLFCCEN